MKFKTEVHLKFNGSQILAGEKEWSISPTLEKFLKRLTDDCEAPFLRVSTKDHVWGDATLELLAKRVVEPETVCFYVRKGQEWIEIVTVCRKALINMFGRVPKQLHVSASDKPGAA